MSDNINTAISLFQSGQFDQALNQLTNITKSKKSPALAWFLKAVIQTQKIEYENAIASFKKALKQQPLYPDAHNNLGVILEKQDKMDDAIKHYLLAIKQRPNYTSALFNLGNAYHQSHDLIAAKKYYTLAIKNDENHLKSHNNLGLLYQQEEISKQDDEHENSEVCFLNALQLNPKDYEVLNNIGYLYYLKNNSEKALSYYQQSININPENPEALNNAAITLQSLQRFDEAEICFKQAIKLKNNYADALSNLANLYKELNKPSQAKKHYQHAININPEHPAANNNLGLVLHREGQYDLAKGYYLAALKGNKNYPEALYNLGTTQLASGDFLQGWHHYLSRATPRHLLAQDISALTHSLAETLSSKHILLLNDQGIGDEIFFLRFANTLKPFCKTLSYLTSPKIRTIAQTLSFLDNVVINEDEIGHYDMAFSIADIPALLAPIVKNNTLPSINITIPMQHIEALKKQLSSFGPPPYIGITWRGGQQAKNMLYKTVPVEALLQSIKNVNATFIILQRQPNKD